MVHSRIQDTAEGMSMTSPMQENPAPKQASVGAQTEKVRRGLFALDIYHPTRENLKQHLNIYSIISRASSNAIRKLDLTENLNDCGFRSIGRGTCAEVFHIAGSEMAIKKLHANHSTRGLWSDLVFHMGTYEAILRHKFENPQLDLMPQVPEVHDFCNVDHDWWDEWGRSFPAYNRERTPVLITERILPIPRQVRDVLIETLCPPVLIPEAKKSKKNKDCLIRIYLGRRRSTQPCEREWTGLRNLEADLTIMLDIIGLEEVKEHAFSMGVALACMHFDAMHNARGVEFVLGTAPSRPKIVQKEICTLPPRGSSLSKLQDLKRRVVKLWLLDFNQCEQIEMTQAGMDSAVRAYFDNDPYYPRPTDGTDHTLWEVFREAYFDTAEELDRAGEATYFLDEVSRINAQLVAARPESPPEEGAGAPPPPTRAKMGRGRGRWAGTTLANIDELLES